LMFLGLLERSRSGLTMSINVRDTLTTRKVDNRISANRQCDFVLFIASCKSKCGSLCWQREPSGFVDSQRSSIVHEPDQTIGVPFPDRRQVDCLSRSSNKYVVSLDAGLNAISSHACKGQHLGAGPLERLQPSPAKHCWPA
jgi:hypothetical protein